MTTSLPPEIELLVMMSAARLGPDGAHARTIVEDIGQRHGRRVETADVIGTIEVLEERGFVSTRVVESADESLGDPIRLVTVEPEGAAAVEAATWEIRARLDALVLGDEG